MSERVLALGAHCDDIEIGLGGTLLRHRDNGDKIFLAIIKSDENLTCPSLVRLKEQDESRESLKAQTLLFHNHNEMEQIINVLDKVCPTVLYFPWEKDTHQHHFYTSQIGYALSRNVKITVLMYLTPTSHSYYPNYISVINMDEKKNLVSLFASQMDRRPKFMEVMEAQNKFYGSLIPGDGHYAEGFVLYRKVVGLTN